MKNQSIELATIGSMTVDDLWALRDKINSELTRKIAAEKVRLDQRLRQLSPIARNENNTPARRAYPRVFPKYVNPAQPGETWSGRGKQPRWLVAQLRSGKNLDEFRIQPN